MYERARRAQATVRAAATNVSRVVDVLDDASSTIDVEARRGLELLDRARRRDGLELPYRRAASAHIADETSSAPALNPSSSAARRISPTPLPTSSTIRRVASSPSVPVRLPVLLDPPATSWSAMYVSRVVIELVGSRPE